MVISSENPTHLFVGLLQLLLGDPRGEVSLSISEFLQLARRLLMTLSGLVQLFLQRFDLLSVQLTLQLEITLQAQRVSKRELQS